MKILKTVVMLALLAQATLFTPLALAQLPPHQPGTICKTPRFWCWIKPAGKVGTRCHCPSPYGPIAGHHA